MDRQRLGRYLAAAVALAAPMTSGAAGIPPALKLALRVVNRLRYSGTRVVEFRRGPETGTHEEYIVRDGARLRIDFSPDSAFAGQVIVEDGRDRRHFLPNENIIRVMPPRRDEPMLRIARAIREVGTVRLEEAEGGPVAGRRTIQVTATDPSGNPQQRLNIDPETGLVLKRTLFDGVGTPIGSFEYTKVDYRPQISPGLFVLARKGVLTVSPEDDLRRLCRDERFALVTIPDNLPYRLDSCRSMRIREQAVLMQTFSSPDGKLSLFQLKGRVDQSRLARFGRRGFHQVSWEAGGATFVLFGPMSQAELDDLAKRVSTR